MRRIELRCAACRLAARSRRRTSHAPAPAPLSTTRACAWPATPVLRSSGLINYAAGHSAATAKRVTVAASTTAAKNGTTAAATVSRRNDSNWRDPVEWHWLQTPGARPWQDLPQRHGGA